MVQTQHRAPHSLRSSLLVNIYILSTLASLCSLLIAFDFTVGPLLVLIPWLVFYGLKRDSPLFHDWRWIHVLSVVITVYFIGAMITVFYFVIFFRGSAPLVLISVFVYLKILKHSITYFQKTIRSPSVDSDPSRTH